MSTADAITEADILSDVIAPDEGDISPDLARWVLNLEFRQAAVDRMNALAEKSRADLLTEAESEEMQKYMRVGGFLSLVKSKARKSLDDTRNGANGS